MAYLFPDVMYARAEEISLDYPNVTVEFDDLSVVYQTAVHQYFNLGYLLSFIPKTNACKTRQDFSKKLAPLCQDLIERTCVRPNARNRNLGWLAFISRILGREGDSEDNVFYFKNKSDRNELKYLINTSSFWNIMDELKDSFSLLNVGYTHKISFKKILFHFPVLKDIFKVDRDFETQQDKISFRKRSVIADQLFRSFLNPFISVRQFLSFTQHFHFRLFEVGAKRLDRSSKSRMVLKASVTLPVGLVKAPIVVQEKVANTPYHLLKLFIHQPIKAAVFQVKNLWRNKSKWFVYATAGDMRGAGSLKGAVLSGQKSASTTHIEEQLREPVDHAEYIGGMRGAIFAKENEQRTDGQTPVFVRVPRKSKKQLAELITIHREYLNMRDWDGAVAKAKEAVEVERALLISHPY